MRFHRRWQRALLPPLILLALRGTPGLGQEPPPAPTKAATPREALDAGRDRLAESLLGIKLSAFGDVLAAPDGQGKKQVDWGSFELDLAAELTETMDAAAAVTTDRDGTRLPVGFVDFHPFGGTIAPRGRLWVEKGFHIQLGRFDVPFGNDWQFFASKDSVSISRPLTTDRIMDGGYNDMGLRMLGNNGAVNFNTFVLRGFDDGRLVGGRIGLTPFGNPFSLKETRDPKSAEFGFSYLHNADREHRNQATAWAADAEGRLGAYYLRAEYLLRRQEPTTFQEASTRRGWHLTQEWTFAEGSVPTTFFLRYERTGEQPAPPPPGPAHDVRLVGGASATVAGLLQLKAEWQHSLEATASTRERPGFSRNVWLAQLVVVF